MVNTVQRTTTVGPANTPTKWQIQQNIWHKKNAAQLTATSNNCSDQHARQMTPTKHNKKKH